MGVYRKLDFRGHFFYQKKFFSQRLKFFLESTPQDASIAPKMASYGWELVKWNRSPNFTMGEVWCGRAWRVGGTWGRRKGRDADLWVCFGRYFGCKARFVCIMTRFVYIWQTLSTPWQSLLQQANFVMHLTNFVCITQINSVCHADDKVCHEVTHFFIPPTNIVCVLYTVYCVLCTV